MIHHFIVSYRIISYGMVSHGIVWYCMVSYHIDVMLSLHSYMQYGLNCWNMVVCSYNPRQSWNCHELTAVIPQSTRYAWQVNGGKCCTLAARSSHCWSVKVSDPRRNASKAALHWCHSATICIFCTLSCAACKQTLLCHSSMLSRFNDLQPRHTKLRFQQGLVDSFVSFSWSLKRKRPLQWPDSSQQPPSARHPFQTGQHVVT